MSTASISGTVGPDVLTRGSSPTSYVALAAQAIARAAEGTGSAQPATARTAVVTAVATIPWTADARVAGATTTTPGIPVLGPLPDVGATVVLLGFGGSYVVLGQLGGP